MAWDKHDCKDHFLSYAEATELSPQEYLFVPTYHCLPLVDADFSFTPSLPCDCNWRHFFMYTYFGSDFMMHFYAALFGAAGLTPHWPERQAGKRTERLLMNMKLPLTKHGSQPLLSLLPS